MTELFFKKIAQNILKIEINTIIKSDMSAVKMPNSRRWALYELATDYHKKLDLDFNVRQPIYWKYAGIRSFGELRNRAQTGIEKFKKELQEVPQEEQRTIREKISMLERIEYQSKQIVGMFKEMEQEVISDETKKKKKGYNNAPKLEPENLKPAVSDENSELWNNDIEPERMNKIPDLDLTPGSIIMIRKAWDIGTEQIILQTIIQLDGDVTTRISEDFFQKTSNNLILQMHNDSIKMSINYWTGLVEAFGRIAGAAIKSILSK